MYFSDVTERFRRPPSKMKWSREGDSVNVLIFDETMRTFWNFLRKIIHNQHSVGIENFGKFFVFDSSPPQWGGPHPMKIIVNFTIFGENLRRRFQILKENLISGRTFRISGRSVEVWGFWAYEFLGNCELRSFPSNLRFLRSERIRSTFYAKKNCCVTLLKKMVTHQPCLSALNFERHSQCLNLSGWRSFAGSQVGLSGWQFS